MKGIYMSLFLVLIGLLICDLQMNNVLANIPPPIVKIKSLQIRSDIAYRFATTLVTSTLYNTDETSREVFFEVRLPKAAFISNFTMLIDDKIYPAVVKEKAAAKKQYDKAKKKGQTAGYVAAKPRDTNRFKVSVNVKAGGSATFNMTYQELLKRRLGEYEHVIYIDPGQIIENFWVDVYISESRPITTLRVPPIRNDVIIESDLTAQNAIATIERSSPKSAHIKYYPSASQQTIASEHGISGQFVVKYDVERTSDAGEVFVVDGYFVHFLAPSGLDPLPKHIIFVLDVSGSMVGTPLMQLKEAMMTILKELRPGDKFTIITFSGDVKYWKDKLVPLNENMLAEAKTFINSLRAGGWTNMHAGLVDSIGFLARNLAASESKAPLMVFLTDGQPTTGNTNPYDIRRDTIKSNEGGIALFGLAFGSGADFNLIRQVAAENNGFSRKIYEGADATLQLTGFYNEISSPLLNNVTITYLDEDIDSATVTKSLFPNYFDGAELVITGKLANNEVTTLDLTVAANMVGGNFVMDMITEVEPYQTHVPTGGDLVAFTEKLWAYMSIKQLLDGLITKSDPDVIANIKAKALELSLKYNFVTDVTSMVVTKPEKEPDLADDDTDSKRTTNAKSPQSIPPSRRGGGGGGGGGGAYNDPHFIMNVEGLSRALCFDVTGNDKDIFQLLSDPVNGLYMNAQVFGVFVDTAHGPSYRTYFDHVVIHIHHFRITITPTKIRIGTKQFSWRESTSVHIPSIRAHINITHHHDVTVTTKEGGTITVLKQKLKVKQTKFLGVHISNKEGFSSRVGGLLGEFQQKVIHESSSIHVDEDGKAHTKLTVYFPKWTNDVSVTSGYRQDVMLHEKVPCWHVKNNGHGMLNGAVKDYTVKMLKTKRPAPLPKFKSPS